MTDFPIIAAFKSDQKDDEKTHNDKIKGLYEHLKIPYKMVKCPCANCDNEVPMGGPFPSKAAAQRAGAILAAHGFGSVGSKA